MHYSERVDEIKALRRSGKEAEAEQLLLRLLPAVEKDAVGFGGAPASWYYEQIAIIRAKNKDVAGEVEVLQRYVSAADGRPTEKLLVRLEKASAKLERLHQPPQATACPACGVVLSPPPTRSRKCPECNEDLVVRRIDGVREVLTSRQDEERRAAAEADKLSRFFRAKALDLGYSLPELEQTIDESDGRIGDAVWSLTNRALLDPVRIQPATVYRMQAEILHREGRDWVTAARLRLADEIRAAEAEGSAGHSLHLSACPCDVCAPADRPLATGDLSGLDLPHSDCQRPPCSCSVTVRFDPSTAASPNPFVQVVRLADQGPQPPAKKPSMLSRLFGRR